MELPLFVLYISCECRKREFCYISFSNPGGNDVITWLDQHFSITESDRNKLKNARLGPGKDTPDPNAPSCVTINVTFSAPKTGYYKTTARFWADTRECRDTSIWTATVLQPGPQITGFDWHERWVTTLNTG